jgi:hypothetical protein
LLGVAEDFVDALRQPLVLGALALLVILALLRLVVFGGS